MREQENIAWDLCGKSEESAEAGGAEKLHAVDELHEVVHTHQLSAQEEGGRGQRKKKRVSNCSTHTAHNELKLELELELELERGREREGGGTVPAAGCSW
jgi:hypothetical protein